MKEKYEVTMEKVGAIKKHLLKHGSTKGFKIKNIGSVQTFNIFLKNNADKFSDIGFKKRVR